jgi:hypothetical protein
LYTIFEGERNIDSVWMKILQVNGQLLGKVRLIIIFATDTPHATRAHAPPPTHHRTRTRTHHTLHAHVV